VHDGPPARDVKADEDVPEPDMADLHAPAADAACDHGGPLHDTGGAGTDYVPGTAMSRQPAPTSGTRRPADRANDTKRRRAMTFKSRTLIGIALSTFALGVSAANIACHDCTETNYRSRALSAGVGDHYVFDYAKGNLRRYYVECMTNNRPEEPDGSRGSNGADLLAPAAATSCSGMLVAGLEANDPAIREGFLIFRDFYLATGGTMSKQEHVDYGSLPPVGFPPSNGASAYEVLNNYNFRFQLGTSVAGHAYYIGRLNYPLGMASAFVGFSDGVRYEIVVHFPDGTTAKFLVEYPHTSGEYVQNSAATANGQGIPQENSPAYQGEWFFNPAPNPSLQAFLDHLPRLGVRIQRGGGRILRCTWDGRALDCKFV
jgi:hypothetical protein